MPDDVTYETVHAAFHFPVDPSMSPSVNWELARFDVIVVDEISMIAENIFKHMLYTLDRLIILRPVVVLSGDGGRQQPFGQVRGRTKTLSNPLNNFQFISSTYHYTLN